MTRRNRIAALMVLTLAASCTDRQVLNPGIKLVLDEVSGSLPPVRISELHYDNTGTDVGEAIEISGPAGLDVTGWSVVLYNGNGGASYNTRTLSGTIPATCSARGVLVLTYPSNGIQNGGTTATGTADADGMALIDVSGQVIEFLSYEGSLTATNGPAIGLVSTDIGIRELGNEVAGQSLSRNGAGVWSGPATSTFGSCNDDDEPPPPPVVASVTIVPATATISQGGTQAFTATAFDASNAPIAGVAFTWSSTDPSVATVNASGVATGVAEGDAQIVATAPNGISGTASLHVNPVSPPDLVTTRFAELHYDNSGVDVGEAIEIEGPAGTDLTGWSVVLYNGNGGVVYNTRALSGSLGDQCEGRGVTVLAYPQDGIQNGSPDGLALVNASGQVVEFLSYEGAFTASDGPAAGMLSSDIIAVESSAPIGQSLQRDASNHWQLAASSFGACNGGAPPPPPGNTISFSGRVPSDPALPVGFEDQLFATVRDGDNVVVPTTITWSSETPALASIDQNGVMHALGAGTAVFRATAADGTTATYSLPTRVAVASTTALYAGNTEFGEPADGDPSDDFILRHPEYTTSYNATRGTPNWVSYDLEASHFGPEDRCDCFTFDPDLPASFLRYTTADYTGAGAFHGYGIDRGHLTRSFDRTSASLDNAFTFYFSNVVPQAADLNQGPWAAMESYLGDLARFSNQEVYIIAGVAGDKGTVKNEGKIVIPASTWKVAVIMPHDHGIVDIVDYRDLEVIAVNMPNDPGVRNIPWQTFETTVDAVEALTGYDLLALLRDDIEIAVESNTRPPNAVTDGPYVSTEGATINLSAAGSSDPDGQALTYAWDFGDGGSATGVSAAHAYAQDGNYAVRLIVTDPLGLADTATTTATVSNVAPSVSGFGGATLLPGETYSASGSFTDPGADPWSATVDYGDGTGVSPLALGGMTFSLSHVYGAAGAFAVTVRVSDDDVTSSRTQSVLVLTPIEGVLAASGLVQDLLARGAIGAGPARSLLNKLDAATKKLERGQLAPALSQLREALSEIDALIRSGGVLPADVESLRSLLVRLIASIV